MDEFHADDERKASLAEALVRSSDFLIQIVLTATRIGDWELVQAAAAALEAIDRAAENDA